MTNNQSTVTADKQFSKKITRVANLDETEITVTKTKLENCFLKYKKALESGSDWKTPLGLIIAIILVFLTAEFNKDFLGFKKDAWTAVFFIMLCVSIGWLLISCVSRYQNRKENIDSLIQKIMGAQTKS